MVSKASARFSRIAPRKARLVAGMIRGRKIDEALTALLLGRRDEIGHPDPALAVAFVLDQLGAMIRTRLDETQGPTQLANRSDDEFVREALASSCAYLQVEAASR